MRPKPWDVDDELSALVELLLPRVERRGGHLRLKRYPGRLVFQGILIMLHRGTAWEYLPQELGFGSGVRCWRFLGEWTGADVWPRLHWTLVTKPCGGVVTR
ncbi:transposase [Streptomyces sp. NPDC002917]|uniref:transposase n=1 Tax=Streptomyces sp. NPDC002917 TaxID=3364671 RepID=UPI0036A0AA62